jgi:hypothetical protein
MPRKRKLPTQEEMNRMSPAELHAATWRQARRVAASTKRALEYLAYYREQFGDAALQELADDPDPAHDAVRDLLRMEWEAAERKDCN